MARASLSILAAVALLLGLAASVGAAPPLLEQPKWVELSQQQREVLAPLAGEWNGLKSYRKKKWLEIAQRYALLSPDEQSRLQRRMQAWVKLTPAQRNQARQQYKNLQKEPPAQRQAIQQKWQEYKELPAVEQARLNQATANKTKPPVAGTPARATKVLVPPARPANTQKLSPVQAAAPQTPEPSLAPAR